MFHIKPSPVLLSSENHLRVIVKELLKSVPAGAHGVVVIVHIPGLHEVAGILPMGSRNLEVRYDQPSSTFPENTVCIGYAKGNLESFSLPNVSENDLETI